MSFVPTVNLVTSNSRPESRYRPKTPEQLIPAEVVWAAAAYAHRINNGDYLKDPEHAKDAQGVPDFSVVLRQPNRAVMNKALTNLELLTESDRALGLEAMSWHQQNMLFRTLKGNLEGFEAALSATLGLREFSTHNHSVNISIVGSQIRSYEQNKQLKQAMEGVSTDPVAPVGHKIMTTVTVIKTVYSKNYNVYFVTAVTESRHAVFFSYRDRLTPGLQCRIQGAVKAHRADATQLNRVRVLS